MNPREMLIEGVLVYTYPGNCRKRIDRIDRLAHEIGAEVSYGLNSTSTGVEFRGGYYESDGLRRTEELLRYLKRREALF